jgi:hypothetical protein
MKHGIQALIVILLIGCPCIDALAVTETITPTPIRIGDNLSWRKKLAVWNEYADMMKQTTRSGQRDVTRIHAREDLIKKHEITDAQLDQIIAQSPESIKPSPTPVPVGAEDCNENISLVCTALIESTQYVTVDDNGKKWASITEVTAKKLESKGLLELTDKYIGLLIDAKYAMAQKSKDAPGDDTYNSAKLIAFCQGRTKQEIKSVLGPPDMVVGPSWYYRNMKIEDVDSGRMLDAMMIMFMGDTALTVSFTGM